MKAYRLRKIIAMTVTSVTALAMAGVWSGAVNAATPTPTVEYRFEGNLNDSGSGSSLTLLDDCAPGDTDPCLASSGFGSEKGDGYWEWNSTSSRGGGFTIDTDQPLGSTYTIAMKFSFSEVSGYNKIIDYVDKSSDNGFYVYNGKINFYPLGSGDDTFTPNTLLDLIVTREDDGTGSGTFTVYAKGSGNLVQLLQVEDASGDGIPATVAGKSRLGFFFDDQVTSSEATEEGRVYSIKMWEGVALSESEVKAEVSGIVPIPENSDLLPGESLVTVDGNEVAVTVVREGNSFVLTGQGFSMSLTGRDTDRNDVVLDDDGNIVLQRGGFARVTGDGFKPNSEVKVFLFSDPIELGTITTNANGAFDAEVEIPRDIVVGGHTLQANGLTAAGKIRSLSIGIVVPAELPPTGSSLNLVSLLSSALLLAGFMTLAVRRRIQN
jgi:hypothetical protein